MADVTGGVSTTSSSPTYTADRFGNANEAVLVNSSSNYWNIASGVYFAGNYTITAWVKNIACSNNYLGFY
jgi:hypothetical protein